MTEEKLKEAAKTKEIIDTTERILEDLKSMMTDKSRSDYGFYLDLSGPHDNLEVLEAVSDVLVKRLEHHKRMFAEM